MTITVNNFALTNDLSIGGSTTLSIVFSEPVTGLELNDFFTLGSAVLSNVRSTDGGTSWLVDVTDSTTSGLVTNSFIRLNSGTVTSVNSGEILATVNQLQFATVEPTVLTIEPAITFEDTGTDAIYNAAEVGDDGTITATVTVPAEAMVGDILTIITATNGTQTFTVDANIQATGVDIQIAPSEQVLANIENAGGVGRNVVAIAAAADLLVETPVVEIVEDINDDGVINGAESSGDVDYVVYPAGDAEIGDTLTISTTVTAADGTLTTTDTIVILTAAIIANGYPLSVAAADGDTVQVTAVATDQAGNVSDPATDSALLDLSAMAPIVTITSDSNNDHMIDNSEDNGTVEYTIEFPTDAQTGDTLTVNGTSVTITQTMIDQGYITGSIPTVDDTTVEIVATITDQNGNESLEGNDCAVINLVPEAPTVVITEDTNNDGVIDSSESQGDVDYTVSVPTGTVIGDTLIVNGTEITVTQAIIDNGYTSTVPTVDGSTVEVVATIKDVKGNVSDEGSDTAVIQLDPCSDTGTDADAMYLWHLGANLDATQGPSDARGKFGGCYGNDINYSTSDMNDAIYIGYTGKDAAGNLIVSPWDGDFERDCGDGNVVWTMNTYAGNDFVQLREDQNAYTVAKLGQGNDVYYVQGALDADLCAAQCNQNARSYIYTEKCHDTVVVGGNGDGEVTGWGIDGGRIFTGSGNDTVTVYGEADDGAVIDLGAGRIEYAPDDEAASTVDKVGQVNSVVITKNLGEAASYDFGHIFGGAGDDSVSIGTYVEGRSIIDLGEGTNSVSIGDDLDGHSKVITGSGDDTLYIGDDTEDYSSIDLGDGNNTITIRSTVEDYSTIVTGSGDDTLNVGYTTTNHSSINLGEGNNTITTGDDVDGASTITTGSGDDVLNIGDDTEDTSIVNLGDGNNTINVFDTLEDCSQVITGAGNDVLTVGGDTWNWSKTNLGAGDDAVTVDGYMYHYSDIALGDGNDSISVSGMFNYSSIDAGAGNDQIDLGSHFNTYTWYNHVAVQAGEGDDIITSGAGRMKGIIDGGAGDDTLVLTYDDNASLVSQYKHQTNLSTKNIEGIETIQLEGQNVVDVRYADLFNDSERDGALFIQGDSDSKVDIGSTNWNSDSANWQVQMRDAKGGHWDNDGAQTVDGIVYDVYSHSYANNHDNDVYVQQGIVVI